MDNSNNPNWPNNPTSVPPLSRGGPSSEPVAPLSSGNWPTPTSNYAPPAADFSASPSLPFSPTTEPSAPSEPISTFPQTSSPLDNPWGAPVQTAQPTWVPNSNTNTASVDQTLPTPSVESAQLPPEPSPIQSEPAPTDLSHLISNNIQPENGQNPTAAPETLVVSSGSTPDVPTISTENHKGIPKWLIGVGVGLLIIVAGTSAYFILGIGQPSKTTTSIPAQVAKTTVKTPPPIATSVPQANPATATESANFGQLQDNQTQQATSAADILRQQRR